jgi:DNA-binding response OmpR family regulator
MDIMMPLMNGIEATRAIREFSTVPVLFLTAKSLDSDKKSAYMEGGDDYLTKPFSSVELLLKVESLLRRYIVYRGKENDDVVSLACGVEVDVNHRTVTKHGEAIVLRDKELDILMYLVEHRGKTVETTELFEAVWQEKAMATSANNVMVNVLNLRKKLEDDPSEPKLIKTAWGRGYRLD